MVWSGLGGLGSQGSTDSSPQSPADMETSRLSVDSRLVPGGQPCAPAWHPRDLLAFCMLHEAWKEALRCSPLHLFMLVLHEAGQVLVS